MSITRFMSRLFSATDQKDEELTSQVAEDIEAAKETGSVDTEEMTYDHIGDGHVLATDKGTGEVTHILPNDEDPELYDLEDVTSDLERFLHPEVSDTVKVAPHDPTNNNEKYLYPVVGDTVSYQQDLCTKDEPHECDDPECPCNETERSFSVSSNNSVVLRTFSDQESIENATEATIRSEQVITMGNLKFQKLSDNEVLVIDNSTGDKAKVSLDGPELEVTELDEKNFRSYSETINKMKLRKVRKIYSEDEIQFLYVVGIDPTNQVLVNVPVNSEAAAQEIANELAEKGVSEINIFACPDQARDYAWNLLTNEGVEGEESVEAEQKTYSDNGSTIYYNRFYTDRTSFMNRLFSEAEQGIDATQSILEASAEDGIQVETESEVITPVDDKTLVVEDKDTGEFTKVDLVDDQIETEAISEKEAVDLTKDLEVDEEATEESNAPESEEKQFSRKGWSRMYSEYVVYAADPSRKINKKNTMYTPDYRQAAKDVLSKGVDYVAEHPYKTAGIAAGAAAAGTGAILGARYLKKKSDEKKKETAKLAEGVEEKNYSDEEATPSLEQIEDKAQVAIDAIQDTADAAVDAIEEAKSSPVEDQPEGEIKEASYSDKVFSDTVNEGFNVLKNW